MGGLRARVVDIMSILYFKCLTVSPIVVTDSSDPACNLSMLEQEEVNVVHLL